ncbi:MAG: Holliday junction branch migration protein RuvA [Saprospiraceae bacterium]
MIAYIKGAITFKSPTFILVETGGIGYRVNISLQTYAQIEKLEQVKILTYFHVKEDSQTLYGFAEDAERKLFIHLISVSGIGPSTAQVMLSGMSVDEARAAIVGENVDAFKKVKGIGPKTAKRIILDLKDKIMKDGGDALLASATATGSSSAVREEALAALVALGYNKIKVQKTLNKILRQKQFDKVEDLIREGLKQLF